MNREEAEAKLKRRRRNRLHNLELAALLDKAKRIVELDFNKPFCWWRHSHIWNRDYQDRTPMITYILTDGNTNATMLVSVRYGVIKCFDEYFKQIAELKLSDYNEEELHELCIEWLMEQEKKIRG